MNISTNLNKALPWVLMLGGAIGVVVSFLLTLDKIDMLKNPAYHPFCNINPIFSCVSVASSPQSEAMFGIPNSLIGLVGFSVVTTLGVVLLSVGKLPTWILRALNIALLLAFIFVHWLISQSVYIIGALCLYCIAVWYATAFIFWYLTLYNLKYSVWQVPSRLHKIVDVLVANHDIIFAAWCILVLLLLMQHFWTFSQSFF